MKTCVALLITAALSSAAETPIIELIRQGDLPRIAEALKAGANPNEKDEKGVTALIYAAAFLNADGVRVLLESGANPNLASVEGNTPLITAGPDLAKVKLLVEAGAEVNAVSKSGSTPLNRSLRLPGAFPSAQYLLSKGAKPDGGALTAALLTGHEDLAWAFLKSGVPVTAGALSAIGNIRNPEIMNAIAEAGKPFINTKRRLGGGTPVMSPSVSHWPVVLRVLLDHGAELEATDARGRTPLMYAAAWNGANSEAIRFLLSRGASQTAKDIRGDTALDFAMARGIRENIEALGGKEARITQPAIRSQAAFTTLRESLTRAIALLDESGKRFNAANDCISCHSQSIPQMAATALRNAGLTLPKAYTADVIAEFSTEADRLWENQCLGGGFIQQTSYGLTALFDEGYTATPVIHKMVRCLAETQGTDGSFLPEDRLRPPLGGGPVKFTALSIRAMSAYSLPGRKHDFEERIAKARHFLETTSEHDTQSLAYRMLGLKWANAPESSIRPLADALAKLQRSDGGWAQEIELASDAFATGEALWSLRTVGGWTTKDPRLLAGASFLRRTQNPDGSWYVRSRAIGIQPYVETGFPHGHDQWLSQAATGYAVLALAPLVEPATVAATRTGSAR